VPRVARWRLASLVRAVDAPFVARLLACCDRTTPIGRRDFAILALLWRLGLPIGDVAALRLEDVDWRAGELVIRGNASARNGCRSRSMSPRRSSTGFATGARLAPAGSC
jgi:integrase/recombinase XerD